MPGDPQSTATLAAQGSQDVLTRLYDSLRNGLELGSVNPTLYRVYNETAAATLPGSVTVNKRASLWPVALVVIVALWLFYRRR